MFADLSITRLKRDLGLTEGDFVKLWVIGAFVVLALLATVVSFSLTLDQSVPYFVYLFPQIYYIPIVLISLWFPQRGLQATILLVAAFLGISAYFSYLGTAIDPIIATLNAALYIWVVAATTLLARDGGIVPSRYKKLFDDAGAGIFLFDLDSSRIMDVNATLERTLGYPPQGLAGRSMDSLWVYPAQRTLLESRLRGGFPVNNLEVCLATASGERRTVLLSCKEIVFEKVFECTATDITALKDLEAATGNAREYFRTFASYSHDLTFLQDLHGTYQQVYWKKSRDYGTDAGELVGKNPYDLLSMEEAAAYMGYLMEVQKKRQTMEREVTISIKGRSFAFSTVLAPVFDESGRVIGVMGSSRDITAKKGEELARIQLEWEIKHRRDFITTAAHELRTPLQPILGYLHLLLEDPAAYSLDAETTRILRVCLENVERERRIVDRMLELSVLYNGKIQIEASVVQLRDLVDTIIAAGGYDQTAEIHNDVPPDVEIVADKSCLYQIIETLISNAVLYNRPPKRAWISYACDGENHVIAVRDTGIGMDKKALSSIFKPFHLPDADNLSRPTNRMGLGLSIAQEYIRLHGGSITVSSTINEGSTFTVFIPKGVHHEP